MRTLVLLFGLSVWGAQTTAAPAFEVATVKPTAPSPDGHTHIVYPPDGSFHASNITLLALMAWAYDKPQRQILDGPSWVGSTKFDFEAKSDAETDALLRKADGERGREMKKAMLQGLFADRFALKVHTETRVLPAYDLVLAKGGSKLAVSHDSGHSSGTGRATMNGSGLTPAAIAELFSQVAGRVVVDRTGLTDRYDFKLKWTPADAVPDVDGALPDLFTAVQEQLGLKLEAAKEPVPVLVVDSVQPPSAN